jgi:hypothetical protein
MAGIGVQTLPHPKGGRLPSGLSSRESLSAKQKQEFVDMTVALTTGASLRETIIWSQINWFKAYRTVRRLQVRIVKAIQFSADKLHPLLGV